MVRSLLYLLLVSTVLGQVQPEIRLIELDGRSVAYTIQDGFAVTQGDIVLGSAADMEAYRTGGPAGLKHKSASIAGSSIGKWPNATMYYTIDANAPVQQNLLDAIAYWNTKPPFKILPRTNEPNYVRFISLGSTDAACNSRVGMVGGEQTIGVTSGCSTGAAIHELGHSWGLLHEQERSDRGAYLTVLYENIDKRYLSNFNQGSSTVDVGYYDYDSIMQYSARGFARNFEDTMETVPVGIPLGQRVRLSAADYDSVSRLYGVTPTLTTVTTTPEGLPITVDGQTLTSPQSFNWAAGTQHSVSVAGVQGSSPRYSLARWTDGGEPAHTITASPDRTVYCAQYVRQFPLQSGVAQGQGTAAIFPAPRDGYLADRYPFSLTAAPGNGWQFVRWTGSTFLASYGASVSDAAANLQIAGAAANYQAQFTSNPLTIVDSEPRGALVQVDGASYYTPASFAWTAGSPHTLNSPSPQMQGTNTVRYQFVQWENGSSGSRTVTASPSPATYTATFKKQYIVTTATSGNGTVSITPPSNDSFYDAGSQIQVSANPGNGQALRYWLGDAVGNNANLSLNVDQSRFLIGYFGTRLPWLVLNSASFALNPIPQTIGQTVAPGTLVAFFGTGIGSSADQFPSAGADGKLPTSAGGVSVLFDNVAAPLIYAGPNQINAVVPFAVAGRSQTTITIRNSLPATGFTVTVADTMPGLFTSNGSGRGSVAALNQDGTVNTRSNPAVAGSIVTLYGTGAGVWNRAFPDGQILATDLANPKAPVFVRFGKLDAQVLYAGTAPFLVNGALQVNCALPADTIGGEVPVQLIVGRYTSAPGTTIWVK